MFAPDIHQLRCSIPKAPSLPQHHRVLRSRIRKQGLRLPEGIARLMHSPCPPVKRSLFLHNQLKQHKFVFSQVGLFEDRKKRSPGNRIAVRNDDEQFFAVVSDLVMQASTQAGCRRLRPHHTGRASRGRRPGCSRQRDRRDRGSPPGQTRQWRPGAGDVRIVQHASHIIEGPYGGFGEDNRPIAVH